MTVAELPDRYERRADEIEAAQYKRWEEDGSLSFWQLPEERELQILVKYFRKASKTYKAPETSE